MNPRVKRKRKSVNNEVNNEFKIIRKSNSLYQVMRVSK